MEQSIENVNLLVSGATGPLTKQLDAYIAWLDRNQYAISLMRIKVLQVLAFDRWLERRDIALDNLNENHIFRYQRRLSRRYGSRKYGLRHIETRRRELFNLEQLLNFLRQQGVCALSPAAQQTPIDIIASEFEHHLRSERGLANETVSRYTTTARQFLADRFGDSPVSLHTLLPADVIEFIRRQAAHLLRVSPHVLRHTTAMDLLQQGVDPPTIALWLGHESVETTQIYIDANLELKEKILAMTIPPNGKPGRFRPGDRLLEFLKSL